MKKASAILSLSFKRFKEADAHDLGAALSYFTIFSLVPLISVIVLIVSFFLDKQTAMSQLIVFFQNTAGQGVARFIEQMIESNNKTPSTIFAAILSFVVLLYAVTNLTSQLQTSLNRILNTLQENLSFWKSFENQVMSFSIVLLQSFVLTIFFMISIAVSLFEKYASRILHLSEFAIQSINLLLTFLLISSISFITYRYLPQGKKSIKATFIGSVLSSVLFIIGKYLIGFYLQYSNPGTGYGVAGTLIIILLWIYYSAQILFFGACAVYATDKLDEPEETAKA